MRKKNPYPKVLHIDDDEDFLTIFSISFRKWFDIVSVESSEKALEVLGTGNFDVVITDYELPGLSGLDLLERVKNDFNNIPVIFYTGQGNEKIARKAFIEGASDYFTKEINAFAHRDKLINSIYRAIEIHDTNLEKIDSARRIKKQHKAIIELVTNEEMASGDQMKAFKTITETASNILGVRRSSIWLFSDDKEELKCANLYDAGTGEHSSGMSLRKNDFPVYFSTLENNKVIDAYDALSDPRACEFKEIYLLPFKIGSMLDASVRMSGKLVGVLCNEHIGESRDWKADEISFAGELADQAAQAIIHGKNKRAEEREKYLNKVLKAIRNVNQIITKEVDRDILMKKSCENLVESLGFYKACIKLVYGADSRIKSYGAISDYPCCSDKGTFCKAVLTELEQKSYREPGVFLEQHHTDNCEQELDKSKKSLYVIMATRLEYLDKVYGILKVSMPDIFGEDQEMQGLFMEVAGDIGFALAKIDMEEAREEAELNLFETEQRYELALKGAGLGVWDWNVQTGKTVFNDRWTQMLGYEVDEIVHCFDTWKEMIHPDDKERVLNTLDEHLKGKKVFYRVEHRLRSKSGDWVWVLSSGKVFQWDGNGKPLRAAGIHLDITDRKSAKKALEDSEKKYRELFESANDSLFLMKGPVILDCNKKTEILFNTSKDNIIGKTPFYFSPEKQPDGSISKNKAIDIIKEAMSGKPQLFDWLHCTLDGEPVFTEVNLKLTKVSEEEVILATARDITRRKKAEEELLKTQALLMTAINQSTAGILIANAPDVRIRTVNPAGLGIRKLPGEELLNISVEDHQIKWQTFYPDGTPYKPEDLPLSRAILKGEVVENEELIIKRSDGKERWVLANAAPVRDNNGNIVAGIVVFPDITEIKKTEQLIKESESSFKTVFEGTLDGIIAANIDTKKLLMPNTHICKMLGYTKEELLKLSMSDLHPPEEIAMVEEAFEQQARGEINLAKDIPVLKKNGEIIYCDINSGLITLNGEKALIAVFRDITEQKETLKELKQSLGRYHKLVLTSPDSIIITDLNAVLILANPSAAKLHGFDDYKELIGMNGFELIAEEDREKAKLSLYDLLEKGSLVTQFSFRRKDNTVFPGKLRASVIKNDMGEPVNLIFILKDITMQNEDEKYRKVIEQIVEFLNQPGEKADVKKGILDLIRENSDLDSKG